MENGAATEKDVAQTVPAAAKAPDAPEVHVPPEALDQVDLSIPGEYEVEIMAGEMVVHLTQYHKCAVAVRAARQVEDHRKAEALAKDMLYCKQLVAWIQWKFPAAKAISDQVMKAQTKQTAANRGRMVDA